MTAPIDPAKLEAVFSAMQAVMIEQQAELAKLRAQLFLLEQTSHQFFSDNAYNDWFYSEAGVIAAYNGLHAHEDGFTEARSIEDVPKWLREKNVQYQRKPTGQRLDDRYKGEA